MTEEFQKTLRHDDFTYTTDLCTSITWMETMVGSLTHLQNSKHRCDCHSPTPALALSPTLPHQCFLCRIQQLHFEMAETLAELKELQLQSEVEERMSKFLNICCSILSVGLEEAAS